MSDRKVDSIAIQIENRKNTGGASNEPANFSANLKTGSLFNFGSGFSQPALLPNASKPIYATHIAHNNQNYQLSIATNGNGSGPKAPVQGNGTPAELNNGEKVDISQWTVQADFRG
ncbi:hypothetical protein E8E12_001327 [Didymella heteroderae]|uniref:Uncharacterized protein n=1 Tax=Didymella heteroderae TaxID=1769908 RepID=A0A9P5C2N8_9PLEO|nr:hypothetical protein E8E12_001327 [Didymella heteroderae]